MTIDDIRALIAADESRTLEPGKDSTDPQYGNVHDIIGNIEGHGDHKDPLNPDLGGQSDLLTSTTDLLKKYVVARILEKPNISRKELARLTKTSESTLKRRMKEWNIVWQGHSKTGHWILPNNINA